MNTYQIDTSISESGVIRLPEMPYLYNKKVNRYEYLEEKHK